MATAKDNIKALFTNTRSRVIIIFTFVVLVLFIIFGYLKFFSATNGEGANSALSGAPSIESVPGSLNPIPEYVELLQKQNIEQAQKAQETGDSVIPTILRTQEINNSVQSLTKPGTGGIGFKSLAAVDEAGTQRSLWVQNLKDSNCDAGVLQKVISEGAQLSDIQSVCNCAQLKQGGFSLTELKGVCSCKDLKNSGITASQMKAIGYTAGQLRDCGFSGCEVKAAGFTPLEMKEGGFTDGELKGIGFSDEQIAAASGIPDGMTAADIQKAECNEAALKQLRARGVTAAAIRRISGCSAAQLKAAGYSVQDLKNAGFTAAELRKAGFDNAALKNAGFTDQEISPNIKNLPKDCSVSELTKARLQGISARTIRNALGCDIAALKAAGYTAAALKDAGYTAGELRKAGFSAADLKAAGFTPKELADAGFSLADLKNAGFTAKQLKEAGFSPAALKAAGFSPNELKDAGFDAKAMKDAGFSPTELRAMGYDAKALKEAGFTPEELRKAGFLARDLKQGGFTNDEIKGAGFSRAELKALGISDVQGLEPNPSDAFDSQINKIVKSGAVPTKETQEAANAKELQAILTAQNKRLANQQYQQQIQQRTADMLGVANTAIGNWTRVSTQVYAAGTEAEEKKKLLQVQGTQLNQVVTGPNQVAVLQKPQKALILTGDILFAVIDTAVNSDEPGPILATIVSGKLNGAKLIGSFTLPNDASKMVISFNTLSVPGAASSTAISAYAVDANTARTALASTVNKHYFAKFGALFASSFLEGFGNAFQSANTTVTVGGTGGGGNVTIQNGIGRSALENAVIGLATVGKNWGQYAQQQMNKPSTVQVFSGTPIGVLFTQDLISL